MATPPHFPRHATEDRRRHRRAIVAAPPTSMVAGGMKVDKPLGCNRRRVGGDRCSTVPSGRVRAADPWPNASAVWSFGVFPGALAGFLLRWPYALGLAAANAAVSALAVVAGEDPLSGALVLFVLCAGVGWLALRGLHTVTMLVALFACAPMVAVALADRDRRRSGGRRPRSTGVTSRCSPRRWCCSARPAPTASRSTASGCLFTLGGAALALATTVAAWRAIHARGAAVSHGGH